MKIDGAGPVRTNATRRKPGADGAAAGDFASHMAGTSQAPTPAPVSGAAQIGSVDALIALQTGDEGSAGNPRHELSRAEDLLDRLDQVRVGILTGRMSQVTLNDIVSRLEDRRREGVEPRLAALIDEIELRAKVELAKLSMN